MGSPSILLLALGFWVVAHACVLLYEEPALAKRFGETYARYCAQVGMALEKRGRAVPLASAGYRSLRPRPSESI